MYSVYDFQMTSHLEGFPHSDIFGSTFFCQLTEAYRRLTRPSSPPIAKAFTVCTYLLVPITLNGYITYSYALSFSSNLLKIFSKNMFFELVELVGIEPTTPCVQSRCSPS
jgi:hypothetical protein